MSNPLQPHGLQLVSLVVSNKELIGGKAEVKERGLNTEIIRKQCEHIIQY